MSGNHNKGTTARWGSLAFFIGERRGKMKKLIIILIILFASLSLAWAEGNQHVKKVEKVEVVNESLDVNIQSQPVDVNLVNQSSDYEYTVFRIEGGSVTGALGDFQAQINTYASEGWELVSFSYQQTPSPTYHIYVGIMKRPTE